MWYCKLYVYLSLLSSIIKNSRYYMSCRIVERLFLVSIWHLTFSSVQQHFFRCSRPFFVPHGAFLPTSTLLRVSVICKCVLVNLAAPMEGHVARRYAFDIVRDVWSSYAWDEKRFSPASEKEKRWKWRGDGSRLNCIVFFSCVYINIILLMRASRRLASKMLITRDARTGDTLE